MEAQGNLNEEQLDDGQAAQILADFNDIDIENQAPINHIDDYMSDFMMDKNKAFDDKLLNKEYTSRSDAYKMLALESTKKYKANIIRQFPKSRCVFQTHVVCVTDKNAVSLANRTCSYSAVIKKKSFRGSFSFDLEREPYAGYLFMTLKQIYFFPPMTHSYGKRNASCFEHSQFSSSKYDQ